MQQVSSNATLFLKIFLPIFWFVFFGSLVLALFFAEVDVPPRVSIHTLRAVAIGIVINGALVLYFSLLKLKRVEVDAEHLFVTNYVKSYKYPLQSIAKVVKRDWLIFKTVRIYFKQKMSFGNYITFLPGSNRLFEAFLAQHPEIPVEA